MNESWRQVAAYWAVRDGKRYVVALSERQVRELLEQTWCCAEHPGGWTIETTTEVVPVVSGKAFDAEREVIESLSGTTLAEGIAAPHVAWDCPHCGRRQTTDLCQDMECRGPRLASPQLWFCGHLLCEKKLAWLEW